MTFMTAAGAFVVVALIWGAAMHLRDPDDVPRVE